MTKKFQERFLKKRARRLKANTLNLLVVTKKLNAFMKSFTLDSKRKWSSANVVRVKGVKNKDVLPVNVSGKPSDHWRWTYDSPKKNR